MSEGFEQTADFALLDTTRLMIWWSVLEFGWEIFISMYTGEPHQTYKETPINSFGHKNKKQKYIAFARKD